MMVGGAAVFEKHANIIVKKSKDCSSQDIFDLSQKMAESVEKKFGIELQREVLFVGEFKDGKNQLNRCIW